MFGFGVLNRRKSERSSELAVGVELCVLHGLSYFLVSVRRRYQNIQAPASNVIRSTLQGAQVFVNEE